MVTSWPARLALGFALGALWRAGSRYSAAPLPGLVHWPLVRTMALAIARRDATEDAPDLVANYRGRVTSSAALIEDYLGMRLPQPLQKVHVLSRAGWVEANLVGMRQILDPLARLRDEPGEPRSVGHHATSGAAQLALSVQLGVLIGFLARRVLGQYDLALLGTEPIVQGRLYFVEPNIAALERRLGLPADDFRLWIALHETTHAFEFEAHPWLREHLGGLLRRYLHGLAPDVLSLNPARYGTWATAARLVNNARSSQYAIEIVMSPEQREVFRQVQAVMAVLEGYSNHVMDRVGRKLMANYDDMRVRFERRNTERKLVERLFQQVTGLNVKLEQYVLGERFVNAVVERAGIAAANRVFSGPDALPTLDEVRAPERWLARVGRGR